MKYVPKQQLEEWAQKDPIARYEAHLLSAGASQAELQAIVARLESELQQELAAAEASPFPDADSGLSRVYGDREIRRR
jgi:TPP-dependent pyruvate/acetoin dehydrogenase alpha subunit